MNNTVSLSYGQSDTPLLLLKTDANRSRRFQDSSSLLCFNRNKIAIYIYEGLVSGFMVSKYILDFVSLLALTVILESLYVQRRDHLWR